MKITDGASMLELTMNVLGNVSAIHPTLLWDAETVVLVDTGVPGLLAEIREAMEKVGVPFESLNKVILTHQDIDHIGSLPAILEAAGQEIEVLAHAQDKPYIEGEKPIIKMSRERMGKRLESLPAEQRQEAEAMLDDLPKAKVDATLEDGQKLPYCGGLTVIFTPGHTPGHISLYHQPSRTLIAGDAMVITGGELQGPNPGPTLDMDAANASLKKFTAYDIATVICYHGGVYRGDAKDDANARIAELAG